VHVQNAQARPRLASAIDVRTRLRPVVDSVARFSSRQLDRAFELVFERDLEVRSVREAEKLLADVSAREAMSRVGTWVALAASLRPVILRMAKRAQKANRVARLSGAGRMAAWSVTGTIAAGRVVDATRTGINELQVMAAYLASRLRDAGRTPSPQAVELAALSLYLRPDRPIDVSHGRRPALAAAARRWVLDAMRPVNDSTRRKRMRVRLEAIASLPESELRRLVDVIPATVRDDPSGQIGH